MTWAQYEVMIVGRNRCHFAGRKGFGCNKGRVIRKGKGRKDPGKLKDFVVGALRLPARG